MAASGNTEEGGEALGLLETLGLVAAIEGTDAMLKAASVRLISQERTVPGLITCKIAGETAAVRSAVDAGRAAAERVGQVVSAHVIPRPASQIRPTFELGKTADSYRPKVALVSENLESLTVAELRKLARTKGDDDFSGRVISKASKSQLIDFLRGD
ncbi:MAG: BMC domain-containing protein [Rubricoccaceae bacterium]|nr:BMC domain-containing protein [Rubricoccaceae bacterium]